MVRRLREAGAIVIGKTHAPEVGQWPFTEGPSFGATRNPWSTAHTPGGSSGGAAAAVAAGLVPRRSGPTGPARSGSRPLDRTGRPQAAAGTDLDLARGRGLQRTDLLRASGPQRRRRRAPPRRGARQRRCRPSQARAAGGAVRRVGRARAAAAADRDLVRDPFGVSERRRPRAPRGDRGLCGAAPEMGHEVVPADPDMAWSGRRSPPRDGRVDALAEPEHRDRANLEPRTRTHARIGRLLSGLPLRASRAAESSLRRRLGRIFDRFDLVLHPDHGKAPGRGFFKHDGRGYWATSTASSAACPYGFAWNVVGWPGISVPAGIDRGGSADRGSAARARRRRGGTAGTRGLGRARGGGLRARRPTPRRDA